MKKIIQRVKKLEENFNATKNIVGVVFFKKVYCHKEAEPIKYTHAVCCDEHFFIKKDETEESFTNRVHNAIVSQDSVVCVFIDDTPPPN